jgi:hypothetical protein
MMRGGGELLRNVKKKEKRNVKKRNDLKEKEGQEYQKEDYF